MSTKLEYLDNLIKKLRTNTNSSGLVFVLNDNLIVHEWWPLIKQFIKDDKFVIHGNKYKPERIVFDNKSVLYIYSNDNPEKAFASEYDWFFIGEPMALNRLRNGIIQLLEDRCNRD